MKETISFDRVTVPASDAEVDHAADEILALLMDFDSPKDACSALIIAHYRMIVAAFPPGYSNEATETLDDHVRIIKELMAEGWH